MDHPVALVTGSSKRTGRVSGEKFALWGYVLVVYYHASKAKPMKLSRPCRLTDVARSLCMPTWPTMSRPIRW